ncbi:MAG: hypothetical protein R3A79_30645 [Nannocystaceae bacterium]
MTSRSPRRPSTSSSTSDFVTLEFQGGEPLVNFPVVKHIIEYALERNKTIGASSSPWSPILAMMNEDKPCYLLDQSSSASASIDGPEKLHNAQRKLLTMDPHQQVVRWLRRINDEYEKAGLDPISPPRRAPPHVTTRDTLPMWKEAADTYVKLRLPRLFLRPSTLPASPSARARRSSSSRRVTTSSTTAAPSTT